MVRDYYGSGDEARLAAAVDAEKRRLREQERDAKRAERRAWSAAEQLLDELTDGTSVLANAVLLAAGYHRHRGEWRKRRDHQV